LAVAGVAAAGAVVAGSVAGREAVRRARARPDPSRDDPLAERPGIEREVISFDGTRLPVHVVGPGDAPTLVFVHGFSSDLTVWHYQWRHFSQRYRCVLYDQRGHGRSGSAAGGDYSLEALGRDLAAVLDATTDGPVVLRGHSMGGMTVLSFASLHPEAFEDGGRVAGVVLANTAATDVVRELMGRLGAGLGNAAARVALRAARRPGAVYRIRARMLREGSSLAFLTVRLSNFGPDAPPSVIEHVARIAGRAPVEAWTDLLTGIAGMDLSEALAGIAVPALLVASDLDRLTPPSTALAMKRRLSDAELVVFRRAGHCTMLERHADFNRVVEEFLRQRVRFPAVPVGA
jgi:pimeloyl-ACP methyl ester carboxylesterase